MSHIYVTKNGAVLGMNGGRLEVRYKDDLIRSIPRESVESISVFGNSTLTTSCIQFVLETGVSVSFFSSRGKYFGRLESTSQNKSNVMKKTV